MKNSNTKRNDQIKRKRNNRYIVISIATLGVTIGSMLTVFFNDVGSLSSYFASEHTKEIIGIMLVMAIFVSAIATFMMVVKRRGAEIEARNELISKIAQYQAELTSTRSAFEAANHLLLESQKNQAGVKTIFNVNSIVEKGNILIEDAPENAIDPFKFINNYGISEKDTEETSTVFYMYPMQICGMEKKVVSDVCIEHGLTLVTADTYTGLSNIATSIITGIVKAKVCIANITGRNANVFYELGVAHALGKTVFLICEVGEAIPFDISMWRTFFYSDNLDDMQKLQDTLRSSLRHVLDK